jgi:acetolactate synthase-1/2/3 large subunit
MKTDKNIAQYLVNKLEKEGVEYVFGYPGEQVLPIYEALRNSKIKHVLVKHEQAAAHAADCYARITGKYGVCIATAGPGAMNLVMGVATAYKDNVPLIVITGDVEKAQRESDCFQQMDINGVFKPITLKSYYSCTPEKLENNIEEVFNYKKSGINGPFHINIPKDVQNKPMNVHHRTIIKKKIGEVIESSLWDTIKDIDDSIKPLIIVGSGVIYAGCIDKLKRFIEKTHIPMATTFTARGIISEHDEMNLGLTGSRGTKQANYAASHADLILAFGCRLSDRTLKHVTTKNIIQINTNTEHNHANKFYNYNIKEFLEKINAKDLPEKDGKWLHRIKSQGEYPPNEIIETEGLHPEEVINTILSKQDENITYIFDAGQSPTYFTTNSKAQKSGQLLFSGGFGPMGYALPASIGASFATDDVIIACPGDGSIQMTIEELATINTYKLPVIIVVLDNNLLGIIKQWQDMQKLENYQVKLDNPDFVALSQAYNIDAEEITSIDQLSQKLDEAIENKKAKLLHVIIEDVPIPMPRE